MKYVSLLCSLFLTFELAGCATIFGDNSRAVQVNSKPSGAQVLVNGAPQSATPATVNINSTFSPPTITVQKPGYQSQTVNVNTTFQPVGILNILFWPGFIIDAISGDMMKITPDSRNINVNLAH